MNASPHERGPGPQRPVSQRIGQFFHDGHRLEFTGYGGGDDWVVLVPAELRPRRMHEPVARRLAAAGNHVVTLDPLGHGRSDRPADPSAYSVTAFAEQVVGLMDHLGIERAVVGGTSLGANVGLEVADRAPERVKGLLVETPVLDNAVEAGILAFTPLLFTARLAPLTIGCVGAATGWIPRAFVPFRAGIALDAFDQRPAALAAAIHGTFFGQIAPRASRRRKIAVPALVVGHRHDLLHPVADARMLAAELAGSTLVEVGGALRRPHERERLVGEAIELCARCAQESVISARLRRT